jgi:hypothetical protein
MANQRSTPFLLVDRERLTPKLFVVSITEMPFDAAPVKITVEPDISYGKHGNSVKITAKADTSHSQRSP